MDKTVSILDLPGALASFFAVASTPALQVCTPIGARLRKVVIGRVRNPGTNGIQVPGGGSLYAVKLATQQRVNTRNASFDMGPQVLFKSPTSVSAVCRASRAAR